MIEMYRKTRDGADDTGTHAACDCSPKYSQAEANLAPPSKNAEISLTVTVGSPLLRRVVKTVAIAVFLAVVIAIVRGGANGGGPYFPYN
jgi:hypothetical protein